ncbi:MAG: potassium transporter TrkG [Candidatus Aenigmatarchaeota archaeon]
MRKSVVSNLGFVLQTAGILMILPIVVSFYYQEKDSLISLLLTSFSFLSLGFLMNSLAERKELDFKSSCLLVTLTFFVAALIGSIPYLYLNIFNSESILQNVIDSYFESISGYTTTGFSLIKNLENLPKSIILYRSLTQWIGGIGIVYLILAFFYSEEILNNLLEAIGFKKTLSRIKNSMLEVIIIYSFYTLLYFVLFYYLGLRDFVTNISIVFSGLSTGGFSPIKELSLLDNRALVLIILIMITGGTSFYIHHSIVFRKFKNLKSEELLTFLLIVFLSSLFFFKCSGLDYFASLFHVTSAATATGFSFLDLRALQQPLKVFLIMLMFIGGSSFSTSGGIKVYRLLVFFRSIGYVIRKKLGYEDKCLIEGREISDNEIILHLLNVILSFILVFIFAFLLSFYGHDFVDSIFECVSAFSNVGLSAGIVNIDLSLIEKTFLILLMGIGRVEAIIFLIAIIKINNK